MSWGSPGEQTDKAVLEDEDYSDSNKKSVSLAFDNGEEKRSIPCIEASKIVRHQRQTEPRSTDICA